MFSDSVSAMCQNCNDVKSMYFHCATYFIQGVVSSIILCILYIIMLLRYVMSGYSMKNIRTGTSYLTSHIVVCCYEQLQCVAKMFFG